MPLAAKKNLRTEKVTPAQLDVETLPAEEQEEQPSTPKVTALIYSYNNAAALRRCITAVERSDERSSIEILVVDKGSRDESPGLDAEFPNTTFLRLPRNFGNAKALNIGLRTSAGELVLFLSPLIEVAPDTIPSLVRRLEAESDLIAVAPLIVDSSGAPVQQAFELPTPSAGIELTPKTIAATEAQTVGFASFECLLARKYFIRGINYFDEHYGEFGVDLELGYQIRRAGRKTVVYPDLQVVRSGNGFHYSRSAEDLLFADRVTGMAVHFGKHFGFFSGLLFRLGQIIKALLSLRLGVLGSLMSGQKIDGSQGPTL